MKIGQVSIDIVLYSIHYLVLNSKRERKAVVTLLYIIYSIVEKTK